MRRELPYHGIPRELPYHGIPLMHELLKRAVTKNIYFAKYTTSMYDRMVRV